MFQLFCSVSYQIDSHHALHWCYQLKVAQYTKTFEDVAEEYLTSFPDPSLGPSPSGGRAWDKAKEYSAPGKNQLVYDLAYKCGWLVRLVHNDETDKIDITAVPIEFVSRNLPLLSL